MNENSNRQNPYRDLRMKKQKDDFIKPNQSHAMGFLWKGNSTRIEERATEVANGMKFLRTIKKEVNVNETKTQEEQTIEPSTTNES